MSDKLLVNIEL